jgi:hypothetical protein
LTTVAIFATTDELEFVQDDAKLTALLPLGLPLIKLQTAFHKKRTTFAHVFVDHFGLLTKCVDIDISDFLATLTIFGGIDTIHSETNFTD